MITLAVVEPTVAMGVEDLVPVLLTGATFVLLGRRLDRPWLFGAAALLVAGARPRRAGRSRSPSPGSTTPRSPMRCSRSWPPASPWPRSVLWWPRHRPTVALAVAAALEVTALALGSTGPLLVATIVGSMAVTAWVAISVWRSRAPLGALLAGVQLAASFLLARLAAVPEQTNALQWTEQAGNTAGAAALLAAAHLATSAPSPVLQESVAQ